ncbi:multiple sugar transport system substrate-binding protein [Diaminobutyricimonas aerilata]|uniref:Multiple sugar transport system substrate-binding protein n=2 Tax=Diaminobutyricimonas aerilata TaxID=1162967 RepID=A0A2M9CGK5_9MICO|nr:multiple sugar transport system substrate-binding protein [Diaminobutyricimonas aerilata]
MLALTVAASITALTACGGGSGNNTAQNADFGSEPTGTLKIWGFNNADDVGTSRLDYAAEQLEGVDIEQDNGSFDAQKFTALAASNGLPDAVQMDRNFVGTYAAKGLLMSLDECYSENDVDPDEAYYPQVIDDVTYDGKVYAVPQFYQPPAIMLNMRVLNAAGVSPDAFDTSNREGLLAAIQTLYKESGGNPTTLGFDPRVPGQAGIWLLGNGGQIMDEDGKPTLDDPANIDAVEFMKQMMDAQGGYAKIKSFIDSFDMFGDNNQFVADQVAAELIEQWYVNVVATTAPNVEISAVPFRDKDGNPFTVASGTAFVIPKGAKNPAAACAWALNLTSTDGWMAAGEARAANIEKEEGRLNTGLFTGSPEADQMIREEFVGSTGIPGFDEAINTYYEVASEGKSFGISAAGQEIQTELQNAITAALLGEKSPEEAMADGQAAALRAWETTTGENSE